MSKFLGQRFLLLTVLSAALAFSLSMISRNSVVAPAVPMIFLLALIPSIHVSGRLPTLVIVIVASCIFAAYLFPPYGSLAVRSVVDRIDLWCFGFASTAVILFSPRLKELAKSDSDRGLLSSFSFEQTYLESWIAVIGYSVVIMTLVILLLYIK